MINEISICLYSFIFGIFFAFVYKIIMINRKEISNPKFIEILEDITFFIIMTLSMIKFIYEKNNGIVRGYIIAWMLCGVLFHFLLLNKLIEPIYIYIINSFKEVFKIFREILSKVIKLLNCFKIFKINKKSKKLDNKGKNKIKDKNNKFSFIIKSKFKVKTKSDAKSN